MTKKISIGIIGLLSGVLLAYLVIVKPSFISFTSNKTTLFSQNPPKVRTREVIGFMPYWLLGKAQSDYSSFITQLAYFSLTVDTDGRIKKLASPVEAEPGWYALDSGKFNQRLTTAQKKGLDLSLTVFNGDVDEINQIISEPKIHAANLASDVIPVMRQHGFQELNLDLESTKEASPEARNNFTQFTKELTERLKKAGYTITIDITGMDLIKQDLIDPKEIGNMVDHVLVMTYDFHYAGSRVTGAVAPLGGAGISAEYDVQTAIEKAKASIPAKKLILGAPVYGYEWETLGNSPGVGSIPGSGITASTQRVERLLSSCSSCSAQFDESSQESYVSYLDTETNTYHQISFPDQRSTQAKIDFATEQGLGGIGIWALGYESRDVLTPLRDYIK